MPDRVRPARRDVRGYSVPGGLRRHLLGELNSGRVRNFVC
ncbi:hypothetical protein C7S16_1701 [Burkholderia thailandensis]|uniref:Uncharacterized protein n=1 Tax=Burkholderia thailandensis TaxID=57975 RepID=A0AAW9CUW0_BURTH|nr:hypothetical protein [Burkholderia thailandensis]